VGKWAVFASALGDRAGSPLLFVCGLIAAANTVASLFYYFRPVRALYLDASPEAEPPLASATPVTGSERAYLVLLAIPALAVLPLLGRLGALCDAVAAATLR
jgi:NADH:ubiquinone oxidoreductase subunit 2 (subunit N)